MLAKNQGDEQPQKKKRPLIQDKLPAHMQKDTKHKGKRVTDAPYRDIEDTEAKTRKKVLARAYSFSMEKPLYDRFRTLCIERGVNSSACVRNLIMLQMKAWIQGDHDETLTEED